MGHIFQSQRISKIYAFEMFCIENSLESMVGHNFKKQSAYTTSDIHVSNK